MSWIKREARKINKARSLIEPAVAQDFGVWADLGCGDGVFTYLLAALLQADSQIYAIDKNRQRLQALQQHQAESYPAAPVQAVLADFSDVLTLPVLDGWVMANALHFFLDKISILTQLIRLLKPGGRVVIIEYNTNRGNYAVPHPLSDAEFLALAAALKLEDARIVSRVPSSFLGQMYCGVALRQTHPE